jgi:hypothetical protein
MMRRSESPHRLAAYGWTAPTSLKPAGRLLSKSSTIAGSGFAIHKAREQREVAVIAGDKRLERGAVIGGNVRGHGTPPLSCLRAVAIAAPTLGAIRRTTRPDRRHLWAVAGKGIAPVTVRSL